MKYCLFLFLLILIPFVSADSQVQTLGTFLKGSNVVLYQSCGDCTYNNISYVIAPNLTSLISNIAMAKSGVTYSYTLSGNYTKDMGEYQVCGFGDVSAVVTTWCYNFFINGTGRADPSGITLTFFLIAFIGILGLFVWLFIYTLGHAIKKDFDLIDLAFDYGIYFAVLGFYLLQSQYLGHPLMDSILYSFVYVGAFTHILFASIFFFISMFRAQSEKSAQAMGGNI